MNTIAVTRFNNETYRENTMWRNSRQYEGCIYNTPIKISQSIFPDSILFILEMNNSTNKIEGIGLIRNHIYWTKKYNIYKEQNYNRYTYKGKYRIPRNQLSLENEKIINILDTLLFTGSRHMKRGQGIQKLPEWILKNNHFNFVEFFINLFKDKFKDKNKMPQN